MKTTTLFTLYFKFQRNVSQKSVKCIHQFIYFSLFYTSFYISRDYFSELSRTSFNITWKKFFLKRFPFLTDFLRDSHPQEPTSTKCDKWILLILPRVVLGIIKFLKEKKLFCCDFFMSSFKDL